LGKIGRKKKVKPRSPKEDRNHTSVVQKEEIR